MFFEIFSMLCEKKGVSRYRACQDVGLNRSVVGRWKGGSSPTGKNLSKLAEYFNVSTSYLLGEDIQAQIDANEFSLNQAENELLSASNDNKQQLEQRISDLQNKKDNLYRNNPATSHPQFLGKRFQLLARDGSNISPEQQDELIKALDNVAKLQGFTIKLL